MTLFGRSLSFTRNLFSPAGQNSAITALRSRVHTERTSVEEPVPVEPAPDVEPIAHPRLGIDGWTFEGTDLDARFPIRVESELAPLMHVLEGGLATPWTYERASELLERHGEPAQAYAVVEAYAASGGMPQRGIERRRARLRANLTSR